MNNAYQSLKKLPALGQFLVFAEDRPRIAAWIVLSLGIVILLLIEARDVGLLIGQWAALIGASILVAGLCIWIVSWEDRDDPAPESTSIPTLAEPVGTITTVTTENGSKVTTTRESSES